MASKKEKHINLIVGKLYDQMKKAVQDSDKEDRSDKDLILFVGAIYKHIIDAVHLYEKKEKRKFRLGLIHDSKTKINSDTQGILDTLDVVLSCDMNSDTSIQKTLMPYQDEILVITCRSEKNIPNFAKIIPHVPYHLAPSSESLIWSSDKVQMRQRLQTYNKKITPAFTVVKDASKKSLKKIEEKVGFPLIVKPSGLAASRLVSICYHKEELESVLKKTFKKMDSVRKETDFTASGPSADETPRVLIEQFIEGEMYSVDVYINSKGTLYFCPIVHIKTGKAIGFDDFFGYQQLTPTRLNPMSIQTAQLTAAQAIRAVGLRSTTAHIEMFKTEDGWKIIELGARVGGFRHLMHHYSHGINHTMNDILVRMGQKPVIPKKRKGYAVAMKFFAKDEGKLTKLGGIKKAQELKSFKKIYIHKKIGDQCLYAKHGGSSVFDIIMFHADRSKLLADIRRLEQMISIETE